MNSNRLLLSWEGLKVNSLDRIRLPPNTTQRNHSLKTVQDMLSKDTTGPPLNHRALPHNQSAGSKIRILLFLLDFAFTFCRNGIYILFIDIQLVVDKKVSRNLFLTVGINVFGDNTIPFPILNVYKVRTCNIYF